MGGVPKSLPHIFSPFAEDGMRRMYTVTTYVVFGSLMAMYRIHVTSLYDVSNVRPPLDHSCRVFVLALHAAGGKTSAGDLNPPKTGQNGGGIYSNILIKLSPP